MPREVLERKVETYLKQSVALETYWHTPVTAEMRRLMADPGYIDSVLADGSARAQALAAETMKAVKDIVGFVRR